MTFKSQQRRLALANLLFGIVVDVAFAWLVIHYTGGDTTLANVALGFLALQAIYLAIGIRNSAAVWLAFFLWGRGIGASQIADMLRAQGFEKRASFYIEPTDYFQEIVDDEGAPLEMRLRAAVLTGVLAYPANSGRGLESVQLNMLYEEALAKL